MRIIVDIHGLNTLVTVDMLSMIIGGYRLDWLGKGLNKAGLGFQV